MITPDKYQQEFIASNVFRATWESGPGSGGTTALIFAALRDVQTASYRAMLLKGHAPLWPFLEEAVTRIAPQFGMMNESRRLWRHPSSGAELRVSAVHSISLMDHERFDFVGIDDAEYVNVNNLRELAGHVVPGGRLRCTLHTDVMKEFYGASFVGVAENRYLSDKSKFVVLMAQESSARPPSPLSRYRSR